MKYLRSLLGVFCALALFVTLLASCATAPEQTEKEYPGGTEDMNQSTTENAEALRLALTEGSFAEICTLITAEGLHITTLPDRGSVASQLTEGVAGLALLSPQTAADLYRSGIDIQIVAVVSPASENLDSMDCLVGRSPYLAEHSEQIAQFLAAYTQAGKDTDGYYLSTGWDMLDQVQQNLEGQYEAQPDSDHAIPDGNFYYLPS